MYRSGSNPGYVVFLGVFAAGLTFMILQQIDRRPAIRITADNIHFKRWNKEWTRWEDIREVKLDWHMGRVRVLRLKLAKGERLIAVRYVDLNEEELLRIVSSLASMNREARVAFIHRLNSTQDVISLN